METHPEMGLFCCRHVLKEHAPAQQVYAERDGDLQIVCWDGDHESAEQCAWVHLHHVTDRDADVLAAIRGLVPGQRAYRLGVGQPWVIEALPFEAPPVWELADVVLRNQQHPRTFHIPPAAEREGLRVGDFAKLVFEIPGGGGERMWVRVKEVCPDGGYLGSLSNDPVILTDLVHGQGVAFGPAHVCCIIVSERP